MPSFDEVKTKLDQLDSKVGLKLFGIFALSEVLRIFPISGTFISLIGTSTLLSQFVHPDSAAGPGALNLLRALIGLPVHYDQDGYPLWHAAAETQITIAQIEGDGDYQQNATGFRPNEEETDADV